MTINLTHSQSGLFNPRILLAFALCSVGVFVAMLSFAAPTLHTKKFPTRLPTIQPSTATMTLGSNSYAWGFNGTGQLGNGTTTGSATPQPVIMPAGVTFSIVSGGDRHSVALDTSGHAWAWGLGYYGQLGNGATSDSAIPVAVSMPSGVTFKAIAAGAYHNLALDTSGNAWAWGSNGLGELGNGGASDSATPTAVIMPPRVTFTTISAGFQGSLALDTTGKAWAWGSGIVGQLGNGLITPNTPNPVPLPVTMPPGVTFIAIASGAQFDLALDTTGKAWAWGYNAEGELGDGTGTERDTPVQVSMPAGVTFRAVAAGGFFSVALDTSGNAWAWGSNVEGELGNGTTTNSATPVQVSMPVGITFSAIAAGGGFGFHSVALDTARKAWAWGYNGYGNIGDGTTINRTTPVAVSMPAGVTFSVVAVGASHSLALTSAPVSPPAIPWAWGDGQYGQMGDGRFFSSITPGEVNGLARVTAIAGGGWHSLALKSDGTVWAWGFNSSGQLGNGSTSNSNIPVQVSGLTGVIAIANGFYHSLALKKDGTVWAWGNNFNGELGNGSTTTTGCQCIETPVQVTFAPGVTVTAIAGGGFHSLALDSNGVLWAWGFGGDGQLGNGTPTDSSVPVPSAMTGTTAIAGGYFSSYALKSDGTVWAWGYNGKGELGNGSTTGAASNSSTPTQVIGLTGVTAISAGRGELGDHAMALKSDGTVWGWGDNEWGQLGVGTNSGPQTCAGFVCSSVPVQVSGLTGVTAVAAGGHHSLALKSDGTAWAWGQNVFAQLGDSSATERDTPVQVSGLKGVIAIAAGDNHSLALAPPTPLQLNAVVSRKAHGNGAGNFDINLLLAGSAGIECRAPGDSNVAVDYKLVFTFPDLLRSVGSVSASATGTTQPGPSTGAIDPNDAHNYIANLGGLPNAQYITVTLNNVQDAVNHAGNVSVTFGLLVGDVNATGLVDGNDVSAVQGQARQSANNTNFRLDVNTTGLIDGNDVSLVQSKTRSSLPSPP